MRAGRPSGLPSSAAKGMVPGLLGRDRVKAAQRPPGLGLDVLAQDTLSDAGQDDFGGLPRIQTMRRGLGAPWGK